VNDDDFKIELDLPEKVPMRYEEIKKELFQFGNYWTLSEFDKASYDALKIEWEMIQSTCGCHLFELVNLIVTVKQVCCKCGYENKSYNHLWNG